jgi:imidazoleglycerol-phosphate dehydratase
MTEREGARWTPARVRRRSRETTVTVELARPGSTGVEVGLEDRQMAHAVESFAAWAELPLRLRATGDERHHVVEDAALALGRGLRAVAGSGPHARVGHAVVPMDDALVEAAVDIGGRPYAAVDERLPALVRHFVRSLAGEAGWTVHLLVRAGHDEHHLVEAAFKALGVAFAAAAAPRPSDRSRKGGVTWEETGRW